MRLTIPENSESEFLIEVKQWLESLGLICNAEYRVGDIFVVLTVFKYDLLKLELKLIETADWNSPQANIEYRQYLEEQKRMRSLGVACIILWQDLWISKNEIVRSRINAFLGTSTRIPGRLTYLSRLDKDKSEHFLNKNHLQGSVSARHRYGLFLPVRYFRILADSYIVDSQKDDLLVGVATFSNARTFTKNEKPFRSYEMIRFASLSGTTVVGGLNKLISAFTKEFHPDDIMTYVDLEWSDGAGYNGLGFLPVSVKPGINFWLDINTNSRYSEKNRPSDSPLVQIINAGSLKFVKTIKQD